MPRDNRRDLEEIPARVRKEITFTFVDHMDQVLNVALKREVQPERATSAAAATRRRARDGVAVRRASLAVGTQDRRSEGAAQASNAV